MTTVNLPGFITSDGYKLLKKQNEVKSLNPTTENAALAKKQWLDELKGSLEAVAKR